MNTSFAIDDTEASIRELDKGSLLFRKEAYISKLAGDVGEIHVRMYSPFNNEPIPPCLGVTIVSYIDHNVLFLKSTFSKFKLSKGDIFIITFVDGSTLEQSFSSGKTYYSSNNYRNFILLPDAQLLHLMQFKVEKIRLCTKKGDYVDCSFVAGYFNRQYKDEESGQRLLNIVANRIVYAKQIIRGRIS